MPKILWHSNAGHVPTGYGTQTGLFTPMLAADGHEVIVSAYYGHHGTPLMRDGVLTLPGGTDPWGNDVLGAHRAVHHPDAVLLLHDIWVLQPDVLASVGDIALAWCPVDHAPLPRITENALRQVRWPLAMSRFGERMMREAGFTDVQYVPHGIDTDVFTPTDREAARAPFGDRFMVMMNAANKGPRKNIDVALKAFAAFLADVPDALLYIHSMPRLAAHGMDLVACAEFYGLSTAAPYGDASLKEANVAFADMYRYQHCLYGPETLNTLYNAADVLLSPSRGEGFGIPVVEAQAAGCPVIVTDFSAQTELAGPGCTLPVDLWDDTHYTDQGGEQATVRPSAVLDALYWAYDRRGDAGLRAAARAFALGYDARQVYATYLRPALARVAFPML